MASTDLVFGQLPNSVHLVFGETGEGEEAANNVRVWNGSTWIIASLRIWNGSTWLNATAKVWSGSAWSA